MKNKFWFWWDVYFALLCVVMIPVVYSGVGNLIGKIWYPLGAVLFSAMAYILWKVDQDERP